MITDTDKLGGKMIVLYDSFKDLRQDVLKDDKIKKRQKRNER